jgi:UDP-galactopyranose mutase
MRPTLDFTVVGSGLFGSVFARCAADAGRRVLVIDRRDHLGGNCFSRAIDGIEVHCYGPHIFHTSDRRVWEFVNRFTEFNQYRHRGVVRFGGRLFSFPINLATLQQVWGVTTPAEAAERFARIRTDCPSSANLEEWIVSQVGIELYDIFVRGYTTKQWGREPAQLPASIIKRLPIRLTWNDNYFDDEYQGIPKHGYKRMFENMLDHANIRVETKVDFFAHREELEQSAGSLIYSGKIDEFFDYSFGQLDYRSLRFDVVRTSGDFQGTSVVNYADVAVPYTRIVEHKHFAQQQTPHTVLTYEYPQAYEHGSEAFYPIRDDKNLERYDQYRKLARASQVMFGGRLGSYQYFDMHQVIGQALALADRVLGPEGKISRRSAA